MDIGVIIEEQEFRLASIIEEKVGQLKEELVLSDNARKARREKKESQFFQTLQQSWSSIQSANMTHSTLPSTMSSEVSLLSDWKVPQAIEIIKVSSHSNNDSKISMLAISGFPHLQAIQIKEWCFTGVKTLTITNLPIWATSKIGNNSFGDIIHRDYSNSSSCSITNYLSFISITIGRDVFYDYYLLVLSGLDSLTTFSVDSDCFHQFENNVDQR